MYVCTHVDSFNVEKLLWFYFICIESAANVQSIVWILQVIGILKLVALLSATIFL